MYAMVCMALYIRALASSVLAEVACVCDFFPLNTLIRYHYDRCSFAIVFGGAGM